MTEINRVLRQAAWRLLLVDFLRTLSLALSGAIGVLVLILIAQRTLGLAITFPGDWLRLGALAFSAALIASLLWTIIRRLRGIALARIVDQRADLRESLSTALYVSGSSDPWAAVVVETARDKARRADIPRAIPIVAPRLWFLPVAMALSMAILWFSLPNMDLLGARAQREAAQRQHFEIQQVREDIKRDEQRLEELLRRAGLEKGDDDDKEGKDAHAPQTPDEVRRAAIQRLTALQDRLRNKQQGDDAQRLEAIRQMMRQLRTSPGPAEQLSRELARGNFQQAQQQLEQLAQKLTAGDLSPEDQARLQEQLQQLSQQLQQLAENRAQLERQLQQAGLSPQQAAQAARDPEKLEQALQNLENLTPEQKQQLLEMAKALNDACNACSSMGGALAQMAGGMGEAGLDPDAMQGMESLADQLSAMEMLQADMASMDAAMSEAMRQLSQLGSQCAGGGEPGDGDGECDGDCSGHGDCDGSCDGSASPWRLGQGSRPGPGQGGGVRNWEDVDAPVNIDRVKSPTKKGDGPIIGSTLVQGDQVRGESVAEFASVVESGTRAATEALETMQVPRELHDTVKNYFGRLESRIRATPPAEPAEPDEGN